jgi:hypothetical protein
MNLQITANTAEVLAGLEQFGTGAPDAITKALNRAGGAGRATVRRTLVTDVGLTEDVIERSFFTTSASTEAPAYVLQITERGIPAYAFGGEQTATGVDIRGGRVSIRSAFLATMKSGHVGFFKRTGRFGRRGNPRLERIDEVKLPITEVMNVAAVSDAFEGRVTREFATFLDEEIGALAARVGLDQAA